MAVNCSVLVMLLTFMKIKCHIQRTEVDLVHDLLQQKHLRQARPYDKYSNATNVTLGITLSQLVYLDAKNQILTTNTWIRQVWYNPYLAWNKTKYGGIETINLDPKTVWKPDITLYNNAEGDNNFGGSMDKLSTRIIIHHTGKNIWLSPAMVMSKCKIDIKYFPFDTQRCDLKFGSWTYDGSILNLTSEASGPDMSKYSENSEWHLISMTATRNLVKYVCCETLFPDVTYHITFKRRSLFYLINLILPLILISSLSCMTFLVPFESGERISLSITILLSMTVFMLLVQNIIPHTSDTVPLVAKYYTAIFIEMTIGVVVACYNLHLYFIDPQFYKMPSWIKRFVIGKLSHMLGVKVGSHVAYDDNNSSLSSGESQMTINILEHLMDLQENQKVTKPSSGYHSSECEDEMPVDKAKELTTMFIDPVPPPPSPFPPPSPPTPHTVLPTSHRRRGMLMQQASFDYSISRDSRSSNSFQASDTEARLHGISLANKIKLDNTERLLRGQKPSTGSGIEGLMDQLRVHYNSKLEKEKMKQDKMEWRHAAMVFDKLWFYVFIVMICATTITIFSQAPGYVA